MNNRGNTYRAMAARQCTRLAKPVSRLFARIQEMKLSSRIATLITIPLLLITTIGIAQVANAAAALSKLSVSVTNDGTAPFDAAAAPGADVSATNGIVRSGDYVFFRIDYEARSAGDLTFTETLSSNAVWHPDSTTNCAQGAAAIDATGRILTCTLSGVPAGSGSTTVKARTGSAQDGDLLTSTVSASGLTATITPVKFSARVDPTINLTMTPATDPGFGPGPGSLSGQTGYRLKNALDLWLPVSASAAPHGNQPIASPITFTLKPPAEYPTSSLMGCGALPVKNSQPFASGNTTNSVRNGGLITCTQSAAGAPVTVTITGTDTSLLSWPTKDRAGASLDASRAYVFVGSVDWWLPVSAWPATTVTLTSQATGFDPTGTSGNSNFGSGYQTGFEPGAACASSTGNCTVRALDNTTPVLQVPSFDSQFRALLPLYTPLPGGTSSRSGDSPFFRGQTGEWIFTDNHRGTPQTSVTLCSKWDPTYHQIADSANSSGNQPALMPTNLEYGAIVYASDAERKSSGCGVTGDGAIGWFPSIAAAGGAGAVTAVRATQTTTMVQGQGLNLGVRTTRTAADLAVGQPIPMFFTYFSDQLGTISSTYNPDANAGGMGQRGRAADVRTTLQMAWNPATSISPGQSRELVVAPSVTAPYEQTPRVAENTTVKITLPTACMKYRPGSASLAPASITAANFGPDGIPCSGDDGTGETLTFNVGNVTADSPSGAGLMAAVAPIRLLVDFDYGIPSPAPYTATGVIAASNSIDVLDFRSASTKIDVISLTGFSVNKSADRSSLYPGTPVNYTVDWINPTNASLGRASVVDVLPFDGDGRTTAAFGTLSVGAITVSNYAGYSDDVTIEYSTDVPAALTAALATDTSGDTGISWSTGRPASGITAVRFVIADLAAHERGAATIRVTPTQVLAETVLGNSVWGKAQQVALGIESQGLTVLSAALSRISGTVYDDVDNSGAFHSGDTTYASKTVSLTGYAFGPNGLNENGAGDDVPLAAPITTTTDGAGAYAFTNVLPGSYSVTSAVPSGRISRETPPTPILLAASTDLADQDFGYQLALAVPVAVDDAVVIPMNTPRVISVLDNDTIAGGGATLTNTGPASSGSVARGATNVTFTPVTGMTGVATFTYTVKNLQNQTATATVRVTVLGPPIARKDAATTRPSTPVTIDALANDEGTLLALSSVGTSPNGTATIVAGKVNFVPAAGFTGNTTVAYSVMDAAGQTASSSIEIVVTAAPVARNDTISTAAHVAVNVPVLANDDGLALVVSRILSVEHGTAVIQPDGTVTFTPDAGFVGTATFTYEVTDATGATTTATVTVTVLSGLVATDDLAFVPAGGAIDIRVIDNDSGTSIQFVSATAAANGTAVADAQGVIRYVPNAGFVGQDTFTYAVKDSLGNTATATVTVNILGAPVAVDDEFDAASGDTFLVIANDDGQGIRVESVTQTPDGTVTIRDNGRVKFAAKSGFFGSAVFTYTITDSAGQRATATVTVHVPKPLVTETGARALATTGAPGPWMATFFGLGLLAIGTLLRRKQKLIHAR